MSSSSMSTTSITSTSSSSNNMLFIIVAIVVVLVIAVCVILGMRLRAKKKKLAEEKNKQMDPFSDSPTSIKGQSSMPNTMGNGMKSPNVPVYPQGNIPQNQRIPRQQAPNTTFPQNSSVTATSISPEIIAVIAAAVAETEGKKVEDVHIHSIEKAPDVPDQGKISMNNQSAFITTPPAHRTQDTSAQSSNYDAWGSAAINDYTNPF